ncbi:MAG: hypothetical protein ACRC23_13350, partial [Aeromonas jandaei]
ISLPPSYRLLINMHKVSILAARDSVPAIRFLLRVFSLAEFIRSSLRWVEPRLNSKSDPDHV